MIDMAETDMYAIVRTGGKQYRVQRGQRLLIERLPAKEGAEVALEPLLYRAEQAVLDKQGLEQVKVTAKVIEHVRGEKLRVFKFKPKRGYRRRTGHRQELTRIEVTEIAQGTRKVAEAAPAGAEAKAKAKPQRAAKPAPAGAAAAPKKPKTRPAQPAKPAASGEKAKAKPARAAKPRKDADGS
jgi:large subunit ribosomal protein L21